MPNEKSMIKRDCGIHWGKPRSNGDNQCVKCINELKHRTRNPKCYQADGTPFIALIGEVVNTNH